MRIGLEWRESTGKSAGDAEVVEVVTPRTNTATLTSAENFFASMAVGQAFSVELAADAERRRFLVRAPSPSMRQQLLSQLGAAYPQAEFRAVSAAQDPAVCRDNEKMVACTLGLRAPEYLPVRTFTDLDLDGERAAQADPVLGILSALGDLPAGWRGLSQVVLVPAPENWCRKHQRLAVQHPLEAERVARPSETAGPLLVFTALLLTLFVTGLQALEMLRSGQLLQAAAVVALTLSGATVVTLVLRLVMRTKVYDMELVREKVTRIACRAEVRLCVYAPTDASPAEARAQLDRLATTYRRFNLASANGFIARRCSVASSRACSPLPWRPQRRLGVLTTLELAGMWHLPHAAADVALLERTTARRFLPLPQAVADGCRIGTSRLQGQQIPVAVPADVLRRHLLLVAKTRRGKSTLMQRLAQYAMRTQPPRSVLLVDPHRDLAEAILGLVPPERANQVVFLDVADRAQPFGLNLLDTGLGWDRDRAVTNALAVFQHEWGERFWGPRMEDAFRYALMTLFEANVARCRANPVHGRASQYTLLEVPAILSDVLFRREVIGSVDDPMIGRWWTEYFDSLERRFQLEVMNPVLTKIHRFEGTTAARHIVGQPVSTIDPTRWLRQGAIVVVNTARGTVGDNAAALIGSTLLNLVTLAVAEQASVQPAERRPISLLVDEFHTIPGADYEGILAELSKYGANLVLATQSLARLLALGGDEGRGLRATVFANLDGLFAFNCSAEDAEYLVPELGGAIDEQDLVELGEHECYVRLSSGGRRLPSFSVQLDPPLVPDADQRAALILASATRYGRNVDLVEEDRRSATAQILELRTRRLVPVPEPAPPPTAPATPARNQHRPRKKRRRQEVSVAEVLAG